MLRYVLPSQIDQQVPHRAASLSSSFFNGRLSDINYWNDTIKSPFSISTYDCFLSKYFGPMSFTGPLLTVWQKPHGLQCETKPSVFYHPDELHTSSQNSVQKRNVVIRCENSTASPRTSNRGVVEQGKLFFFF